MQNEKLSALSLYRNILSLMFSIFLFIPVPTHAEVDSLYQLGEQQFELKQFDSAIACFSQLIVEYPQRKEGYYNRGLCFYQLQKYDNAISDFDKCLQIDSVFKQAEYLKAVALQKKGDLKSAYTGFEMLNTKYTGYNDLKNRVLSYRLAVKLSTNWYYMLAIMFMIIFLFAVVSKSYSYRKW